MWYSFGFSTTIIFCIIVCVCGGLHQFVISFTLHIFFFQWGFEDLLENFVVKNWIKQFLKLLLWILFPCFLPIITQSNCMNSALNVLSIDFLLVTWTNYRCWCSCFDYIEEMIHKQEPLVNVLRLLILFSITNAGIPKRNFDQLR